MKFNNKRKNLRKGYNYEGGVSYDLSKEMALYSRVCTSFIENKFYESADTQIAELRELVSSVNPEFVCKLAIYAREEMNLRSIPLVLMVELLLSFDNGSNKGVRNSAMLRNTISRVIKRADEITEILSYFSVANDRTGTKKLNRLPKVLSKAIAMAFMKFDEYQIAKYNRSNEVTLKDALFLTHAKDKKGSNLFDKLANDTLEAPYTWEVEFSKLGKVKYSSEEDKNVAKLYLWKELVSSKRLGYMALLRNLRNMLNVGMDNDFAKEVAKILSNEKAVHKSKQLPFRFFSAYRELYSLYDNGACDALAVSTLMRALETAVKYSINNLDGFGAEDNVLIASDVSGSMTFNPVSRMSSIYPYHVGLLLSHLFKLRCENVATGIFGTEWKLEHFDDNNILRSTLTNLDLGSKVGHGTNGYKVLSYLNKADSLYDKVLMFTDCQMWNKNGSFGREWNRYKEKNPKAKLFLFDLNGYGNTPVDVLADKDVYLISGWSDKVFKLVDAIENKEENLAEINKIKV